MKLRPRRTNNSNSNSNSNKNTKIYLAVFAGFILGCFVCTIILLSAKLDGPTPTSTIPASEPLSTIGRGLSVQTTEEDTLPHPQQQDASSSSSVLSGLKILVAVAAFDFAQLPHLEEMLDGYSDVAAAGATVKVVVHTTMPYPVTLIDLLNTRFASLGDNFHIEIVLVSPTVRLHLVDLHRPMFYKLLEDYDLFIYTEDDIRVTPKTVATYWTETIRIQQVLGKQESLLYNVGIVRYEYNFPKDLEINDKTRHATQNVTRVYWEHSYHFPVIPKVVDIVKTSTLDRQYVHMRNHHQGMFLATRDLLKAWRDKCKFDVVTDRPGGRSQPSEGTQRVWMSSQQLYGGRHCGIQQVIPIDRFGALTCLHLPNKNYRRVGHFRNRTFSDGTETFDHGAQLLTALGLHLELRAQYPQHKQDPYKGITMVDQIDRNGKWNHELKRKFSREDYFDMVDRRMRDYDGYVMRGGILTEEDLGKTVLVDIGPPPPAAS